MFDAAVMADEFALTHKGLYGNRDLRRNYQGHSKPVVAGSDSVPTSSSKLSAVSSKANIICFYCKKPGHKISECFVLGKKAKSTKPVGLTAACHFPVQKVMRVLSFNLWSRETWEIVIM